MRFEGTPVVALAALLAVALPGCLGGDDGAVFGPVAGDGGDEGGNLLPVVFKAKPARGAVPLDVQFGIVVPGDAAHPWTIDFGDGSTPAKGDRLPANVTHRYTVVASLNVTATVGLGEERTKSRLVVAVLPPGTPVEDPEEEAVGETEPEPSSSSSSSDEESETSTTTSSTSSSTEPAPPPPPPPPPPSSSSASSTPPPPPSSSSTSGSAAP